VKGRTEPYPAWKYRGGRWNENEVSTMEGILFDIEMFVSPFTVVSVSEAPVKRVRYLRAA